MKKTYPLKVNMKTNMMCQYDHAYGQREVMEFPGQFTAELQPITYEKGRSSLNIILQSTNNGRRYYMSMKEFWRLFEARKFDTGLCKGEFRVIKNGANYHIVLNDAPQEFEC